MSVVLLRARCSNCTPGDALDTCGSSPYGSDGRDLPPWSSRPSPDHAKGHRMSDIVGFIGLGTMGMPMTANLAKAGVAPVVYDASPPATAAAGTLEVHRALLAKSITHMDTPMLGSQPQAVSGEIFFIVGGDEAAVERIAPYLDIMGKLHMYVGGPAMGNRVKLVHNGLVAVTAAAVAEALAVCVQSGVDPYTFYDVVRS